MWRTLPPSFKQCSGTLLSSENSCFIHLGKNTYVLVWVINKAITILSLNFFSTPCQFRPMRSRVSRSCGSVLTPVRSDPFLFIPRPLSGCSVVIGRWLLVRKKELLYWGRKLRHKQDLVYSGVPPRKGYTLCRTLGSYFNRRSLSGAPTESPCCCCRGRRGSFSPQTVSLPAGLSNPEPLLLMRLRGDWRCCEASQPQTCLRFKSVPSLEGTHRLY